MATVSAVVGVGGDVCAAVFARPESPATDAVAVDTRGLRHASGPTGSTVRPIDEHVDALSVAVRKALGAFDGWLVARIRHATRQYGCQESAR